MGTIDNMFRKIEEIKEILKSDYEDENKLKKIEDIMEKED